MAYFPNGSAGDAYESQWCRTCVHSGKDGTRCAVMLAHVLFSYTAKGDTKDALDTLIPMDAKGLYATKCTMFITREQVTRKRAEHKTQLKLGTLAEFPEVAR